MMGLSPDATYQVSWKSACRFRRRRFSKVFTIYGRGDHLGHVTKIMSSDLHYLVPENLLTKFGSELHSSFLENPVLMFVCSQPSAKVKK